MKIRFRLADAIWDGIADDERHLLLTDAQKAELERRVAAADASPDDVIPWDTVKAEAEARIGNKSADRCQF